MCVYIVFHCYLSLYRLALAALHFNENASRKQAVTAKGQECYDILYPKYKKGGHIVRKVTVNPTYREYIVLSVCVCFIIFLLTGYVDDLVKETLRRCKERVIETLPSNTPGPLSSQYERPDKPTAIKSHKSRFV